MRFAAPLLLIALAGCTGEEAVPYDGPPVADAGPDAVVPAGALAELSAEGSFCPSARTCTYSWFVDTAPVESLTDDTHFGEANGTDDAAEVTFAPDTLQGSFVLGLVVEDGLLQSEPDYVVVTVHTDNAPPVAECGSDQLGVIHERLVFDGGDSRDPEGAQLTWTWALEEAPAASVATLFDSRQEAASLVPDAPGTYLLSLRVDDGLARSEPCFVTAEVADDASVPEADAGEPQTLTPCEDTLQLNGNGSWDADGDPLTYAWRVAAVPEGSALGQGHLSDPAAASPWFPTDLPGEYSFSLQVHDGALASSPDAVTHTVPDPAGNVGPRVRAGADQRVELEQYNTAFCHDVTLSLDGTATFDANGDDIHYIWTVDQPDADIASPGIPWTEVSFPRTRVGETRTWTFTLEAGDCDYSSRDTVEVEITCSAEE